MLKVGDRAPAFTAQTDGGETVRLADFRGRKVVLYFYPKDDTPGCTREACSFRDHHDALQAAGAVVLGVSADSVASHRRFKEKYRLPFSLLSDPDRKIVTAYGVWKEKTIAGRLGFGIERTTFIIDEQGIITHIFPKVRVDGHTEEVLAALGAPARRSGGGGGEA
ncbi:MAG: thioredoxin-dependent thiol peroxidase [Armatimonadota bacterium]|nr:thioredoxin-dependent thiol peroxidase [Armatimonadota bacterium]